MNNPLYFDRELSWLEFNQRVLNEALNSREPLLERLKFLAISASNLDEFFRVRVGAMTRQVESGSTKITPSGLTPTEQLSRVRERIQQMINDQYKTLLEELLPELSTQGLRQLRGDELNTAQKGVVRHVFTNEILSVLTPMAVGDDRRFPLLPNQVLNLCVRLARQPPTQESASPQPVSADRYAVIPLGQTLSRFFTLPAEGEVVYMHLEEIVKLHVEYFFDGEQVLDCGLFRITRNAEIEVDERTPQGLADNMRDVLVARNEAECLRLEVEESASPELVDFLQKETEVQMEEVYRLPGPLDLGAYMELATRRGFESLKYDAWPPLASPDVPSDVLMFDIISEKDVLLVHPYQSFDPVVRLLEEAAEDPDVIAIKQTLYRISRNSPIIQALKRAVENGKHVTVLLELKARFDEERNLKQARELEAIGAHVIHGVKGLKTHAKVCIIVRREPGGIQRYLHFGTGNYNEATAKIYSDVSLLTCDEDLGADAIAFFNSVAGDSQPPQSYRKLESAPLRLRSTLLEMILAEGQRASDGQESRMIIKLNALTDRALIDALYQASQAGVKILLNVRGICCLRPGIEGLSDNITVVSIVDRFLEHARILYFHHGGDPRVYISSADWMPRNLDHRKELLVPVESPVCRKQLIHILHAYAKDNVKASRLLPDGQSVKNETHSPEPFRVQEVLYREARQAVQRSQKKQRTMFEPHHF